MHPDAAVRRRALCPKELATAYAGAQEVSGTARCWKDCAHHPVALAIYAARKAGWQFVNAVTLRDASGQERSLVHGSPAVLRQLLLQDFRSSNASRDAYTAAQRLEAPSHLAEDLRRRGVWLLPVQKLLRSRASGGLTGNEATRLVQATTGQLWTGAVLARRGILASPDCPHCGAEDTVFHRVWICPFGQNVREVVASADLVRAAVAAGPTSPLFARALAPHPVEPEAARSDGLVVHWARTIDGEGAFRAQQGPIFVDGSAVNPHHPAIASAACAAVQVDVEGKVLVSLRAAVPRGWPQTAACAERLVIGLVAQFVHGHCDIYSDCQGVVQEWNQSARSTDARAVWGGLWRQILQTQAERRRSGGIGHIFKCKAHQLKEVCERGDPHDLYVWHGNDAADRAAKETALAASPSKADIAQYECEYARAVGVARTFGRVLALWPPARQLYAGKAAGERGVRDAKADVYGGRHQWRKCQPSGCWQCDVCLRTTRQPTIRRGGCLISAAPEGTRVQAATVTASRLGHAIRIFPTGDVLLLACVRCGAYAQRQGVKLARPCPGRAASRAASRALQHLRAVPPRHPASGAQLLPARSGHLRGAERDFPACDVAEAGSVAAAS